MKPHHYIGLVMLRSLMFGWLVFWTVIAEKAIRSLVRMPKKRHTADRDMYPKRSTLAKRPSIRFKPKN